MKTFRSVGAFAAIAIAVSVAQAGDWPQYRGLAGDGKSVESIGQVSSDAMKVLWNVPAPLGFSSMSVADGLAYTLIARDDKETVVALDAATGQEVWSVPLGSSKYEQGGGDSGAPGNRGGDGPRSTPTVDGDRLYVYDSYMVLSCLDTKTGRVLWQHDVIAENEGRNIKWLNASSPLIEGNRVIVGGGGAGQSFLAFDKSTGDRVWASGDETVTHATPILAEVGGKSGVVFFTQSGLVAVGADDGQEVWRAKFPFSVSTAASPVADGDLVYCSAGYGVGAGLFKIDNQSTPQEMWYKSNELMNHWSTPVVHDGHLYGIFEFKKYGKAPLQCVELSTGEIKWNERGFGPGNCILVGDKLVVLSDAGEVVIAKATPTAYEEVARKQVLEGKCWSTPAYSDGKIFVRSTQQAACVAID
ncbi:PQQ-binding-like beta-propeller repeat protein [Rubripirellula lacrimiformis]|nr:PQQ-binding-like beta-propeller repeat protein [Rubripirellula lacrimiformis]